MTLRQSRRQLLKSGLYLGCSLAAHPLMTTVTLAGSDGGQPLGDKRLIVVILRGAMDGLDLVQPLGDPAFAALRPGLAHPPIPALPLVGPFALHPAATGLHDLWRAGELSFVHATSTPYRDGRSHFQGQDLLEAGTGTDLPAQRRQDGWLNRMLQAVPGLSSQTAYSLGRDENRVLAGAFAARSWAPELALRAAPETVRLLEAIAHDDDLFREAIAGALEVRADELIQAAEAAEADPDMAQGAGAMMAAPAPVRGKRAGLGPIADYAAARLREETRIAVFSLSGWDTHKGQANGFADALGGLQQLIIQLKASLGPQIWQQTALLGMTEFGRTARENGSGGTDHGTGSVMIAAGGAIKGGQVLGQWPGVGPGQLYADRDLLPTSDVRAWAAHVIQRLYGFDETLLTGTVFPGLVMQGEGGLVL